MTRIAAIFPGQGAQSVGMGRDFAAASAGAAAVFERANQVLGLDLRAACFDGPAELIERTDIQQPAIFVTSVAIWTALCERGLRPELFSAMAGLSLGEYTALHLAGAVEFEEALRLVHRRGELMQEAATAVPSGMVSLVGADVATAERICAELAEGQVLSPANFNCPGQIVVSGSKSACERVVQRIGDYGCRALPLKVAGAFHSKLMQPAADRLAPVLQGVRVSSTRVPVLSNVSAAPHGDPQSVRTRLRDQVTHPVRWQECIERLVADGCELFVEIGPGRVLTGLMKKINRDAKALNVGMADQIDAALAAISGSAAAAAD